MKAKSERRTPFVGDQVEECRDASGLFFLLPFQKVRTIHLKVMYWLYNNFL